MNGSSSASNEHLLTTNPEDLLTLFYCKLENVKARCCNADLLLLFRLIILCVGQTASIIFVNAI
jgi:hypothetical protein